MQKHLKYSLFKFSKVKRSLGLVSGPLLVAYLLGVCAADAQAPGISEDQDVPMLPSVKFAAPTNSQKKADDSETKSILEGLITKSGTSNWQRLFDLGNQAYDQARYDEAARYFEDASKELKKRNELDERLVKTRNRMGQAYVQLRQSNNAEAAYELAWEAEKKLNLLGSEEAGKTLRGLANLYKMEEKWAKAESKYKEAIKVQEDALGASSPEVGKLVIELADLYRYRKLFDQAEPFYKLGVEIFNKSNEPYTTKAEVLERTGIFYLDQGKLEQARAFFEPDLKMKDKLSTFYVQTDPHNLNFVTYTCFNGIPNSYHAFTRGMEAEFINIKDVGVLSTLSWQYFNPMWTNVKCQITIHNNGKTPISAFNEEAKLIVRSPNYHEYLPLSNDAIAQMVALQGSRTAEKLLHEADFKYIADEIYRDNTGFAAAHFSPDWQARIDARNLSMQYLAQTAAVADTIAAYKPGNTTIAPGETETFLIYFKNVQFSYAEVQVCIGNTLIKFPYALKTRNY